MSKDKKEKVRFHNKLFFKIYLYFGILITLFAILIGFIFMKLYTESTNKTYLKQLQTEVENISYRVSEFSTEENYDGFASYIEILQEQSVHDVWIISYPEANNQLEMINAKIEDLELEESDIKDVCQKAFSGKSSYAIGKSPNDIYQEAVITVGVPVYDSYHDVIGAVVINSFIEGRADIINRSKSLIIVSSLVAVFISFIVAILFARMLSYPISKMSSTAIELAAGNYHIKTGIHQNDEIGELAQSIDVLSDKLGENEEERKNLDQMRVDFFANVSHELRTPITVVRAYIETLLDGVVTDEEKVNQYYGRILSECQSMQRLVGDLLVLSKMQNPDFEIDAEPVNISQVFDDIIRSVHAISDKKNIKINIEKDGQRCMIKGDYDRLRQMFMVILDNAVKFSDKNSSIYINIIKTDKIIVSIRDEGIGISEEELPNIFDKFYKSKLRQNAQGSGLGLAIAKQIALKHNGNIEVKSKAGMGTEFIFTFDINTCDMSETEI